MLDIDLIEARASAATPGPWVTFEDGPYCDGAVYTAAEEEYWGQVCVDPEADDRPTDRQFIAHARDDIPDLIAEVRRMRAVVKAACAAVNTALVHEMLIDNSEPSYDVVERARIAADVAYDALVAAVAAYRQALGEA